MLRTPAGARERAAPHAALHGGDAVKTRPPALAAALHELRSSRSFTTLANSKLDEGENVMAYEC